MPVVYTEDSAGPSTRKALEAEKETKKPAPKKTAK